jgi:hypothetical protein
MPYAIPGKEQAVGLIKLLGVIKALVAFDA